MISKRIIMKVARTKERYEDIINLLENKKYDEIFEAYGQRIYNLVVPKSYKKKDLKKLVKSGRAEDIYRKYGDFKYRWHLNKMRQIDVYNETGSKFKSGMNRVKNIIKRRIAPILISLHITLSGLEGGIALLFGKEYEDEKNENTTQYSESIKEYEENTKRYAKKINNMNLTHIQIFAKLMKDMWNEIDGYGKPKEDITGYLRLSIQNEGIGVCRNFADHIATQLNAINSKYNARIVAVYMDMNKQYRRADIERNSVENNETVDAENNFDFKPFSGNHAVTAVDIPDKNITLIIDPTNPSLGVFKNGKIYMFSSQDGKGLQTKEIGQAVMGGIISILDIDGTIIKSFLPSEQSLEELEEEFGIDALNKALVEVADIEEKMDAKDGNTFVAKAKVDEKMAIKNAKEKAEQTTKKDNEIAD